LERERERESRTHTHHGNRSDLTSQLDFQLYPSLPTALQCGVTASSFGLSNLAAIWFGVHYAASSAVCRSTSSRTTLPTIARGVFRFPPRGCQHLAPSFAHIEQHSQLASYVSSVTIKFVKLSMSVAGNFLYYSLSIHRFLDWWKRPQFKQQLREHALQSPTVPPQFLSFLLLSGLVLLLLNCMLIK